MNKEPNAKIGTIKSSPMPMSLDPSTAVHPRQSGRELGGAPPAAASLVAEPIAFSEIDLRRRKPYRVEGWIEATRTPTSGRALPDASVSSAAAAHAYTHQVCALAGGPPRPPSVTSARGRQWQRPLRSLRLHRRRPPSGGDWGAPRVLP